MTDFCGECALLDRNDCKWNDRYYCKKTGKRCKLDDKACRDIVKQNNNKDEYQRAGCYITTIVCKILGYPDNCEVLNLLREVRESYLKTFEEGRKILQEYDQIGPIISEKISLENNKERIAAELLRNFIIPCTIAIKAKDYKEATTIYFNMTSMLKSRYDLNNINVDFSLNTPIELLGKARCRVPASAKKSEC